MQSEQYPYHENEDFIERFLHRSGWGVNQILVAVNVIVFLLVTITGGSESSANMLRWGADYAPLVARGEYWRLFSCMFLHFGPEHLLNNMILLLFLGDYLERYLGKIGYLLLYLVGGFLADYISFRFAYARYLQTGKAVLSAGASGAVFAVTGAMIVLILIHKGQIEDLSFRRMVLMAGISLYLGFESRNVDNYAHVAGLIAGMAEMGIGVFLRGILASGRKRF